MRRGILLVNTGSPDSPHVPSVRRYLKEFLSDPRVMDAPFPIRQMVLRLLILPFRPKRSAALYQKIWRATGSPLIQDSLELARLLEDSLGQAGREERVIAAMRYGNPSLELALDQFEKENIRDITVLPLFPQEASATSSSVVAKVYQLASRKLDPPNLSMQGPFFDHPDFSRLLADVYSDALVTARERDGFKPDHILFSFHGLPERHVRKSNPAGRCLTEGCCDRMHDGNEHCYRAQSFETARSVAGLMGLDPDRYTVSFQSRLGRIPWIRPYTDETIRSLAKKGVRHLAIGAPSFVTDCLETLEELRFEMDRQFREAGGESLVYLPAPNLDPRWVSFLTGLLSSPRP